MNSEGLNRLARVLNSEMVARADKPCVIDVGCINRDFSLTTNGAPIPIPATDYHILRGIARRPEETQHRVSPGERVLVAWIGAEAFVLDAVEAGTAL